MENLEKFVDDLIEAKGFAGKDLEIVEQIKLDLLDRVEDRINAMIMEKLPPIVLEEFEKVLDNGNPAEIQEFITQYIPDIKERTAFKLMSFRNMYLS